MTDPSIEKPPLSAFADPIFSLLQNGLLDPPLRPGEHARLQQYVIVRFLGWGGMGMALLATDTRTGTQVVVKTLKPEWATRPEAKRQFIKEGRLAQSLDHPHIVKIIAVEERKPAPYLIMPFMPGGTLADRVAAHQRMPAPELLQLAIPLAEALCYAHSKGIIHRDVKPSNILLDADCRPCLADFGLVRTVFNDSILSEQSHHGDGTPAYMSPAVASGVAEDTRCDIYAFGATLYALLAGDNPYAGTSPADIISQVRKGPPVSLRSIRPDLPPSLIRVVEGAMGRELRNRYAEMGDVLSDLRRIQANRPIIGVKPETRLSWKAATLLAGASLLFILAIGFLKGFHSAAPPVPPLSPASATAPAPSALAPDPSSWIIEPLFPTQHAKFLLADVDGKPPVELASLEGNRLLIWTSLGRVLVNKNVGEVADDMDLVAAQDVVGDSREELLVRWSDGNDMAAGIMNQVGFILKTFKTPGKTTRQGVNVISRAILLPFRVQRNRERGTTELLAIACNGYGLDPRGIYGFDINSGDLRWRRLFGPAVSPDLTVFGDVNHDGNLDLILGSAALGNGNVAEDGTRDDTAYLFAVSPATGESLWTLPLGRGFLSATPLGLKNQNRTDVEVPVWVHGADYPDGFGKQSLVLISAKGLLLRKYDPPIGGADCRLLDLHGTGHPEIVFSDYQGYLGTLSLNDLSPLLRKRIMDIPEGWDRVKIVLSEPADVNGDGKRELVVAAYLHAHKAGRNLGFPGEEQNIDKYGDVALIALSEDLKPVACRYLKWQQENDPSPQLHVQDFDGDGKPDLLVVMDKGYFFRLGSDLSSLGWQKPVP